MSLSEHLTSCGLWTGHGCTCWLDSHPEVAEDPKDATLAEMEATIERLKVGGNCAHWYAGLLGCEMDAEQSIVCEGRDHCKVFNQAIGGPREPCWTERGGAS